jgi:hypothetical protein
MKKIIVLIAINILLLGIAFQVTNEDALLTKSLLSIGKTYVDKNNKNNKIVLYGDYSAEIIKCLDSDCKSDFGNFKIDNSKLVIEMDGITRYFTIKDNSRFVNDKSIYVLE